MTAKVMIWAAVALVATLLALPKGNSSSDRASVGAGSTSVRTVPPCPSLARAKRWAKKQHGVSFALFCNGKITGYGKRHPSFSASTGKALLLLAFLRRGRGVASARPTLRSMIRHSDNDAASAIYNTLGDAPLRRTAAKIGLRGALFCGCWSSIRWSPADYVRLFYSLPLSVPKKHRHFAMSNLRNITASQRWGIPEGAGKEWRIYFKGGWRPESSGWIVLQGALLERAGQHVAWAVFTNSTSGVNQGARKIKKATRLVFAN